MILIDDRTARELMDRPFFEESFARHCRNYGMTCSFAPGLVFIRTPFGNWRVEHQNCYVCAILHESSYQNNSIKGKRGKLKFNEGYHKQVVAERDIYAVVRYISAHDRTQRRASPANRSATGC